MHGACLRHEHHVLPAESGVSLSPELAISWLFKVLRIGFTLRCFLMILLSSHWHRSFTAWRFVPSTCLPLPFLNPSPFSWLLIPSTCLLWGNKEIAVHQWKDLLTPWDPSRRWHELPILNPGPWVLPLYTGLSEVNQVWPTQAGLSLGDTIQQGQLSQPNTGYQWKMIAPSWNSDPFGVRIIRFLKTTYSWLPVYHRVQSQCQKKRERWGHHDHAVSFAPSTGCLGIA